MIGCGVYDGQAREFSTVEVAEILEVNRMNFYEWTCRKYIQPVRESKRRGNAAVFDMAGLVAAALFKRLCTKIRRPIAGRISQWYQDQGYKLRCEQAEISKQEPWLWCFFQNQDKDISFNIGVGPRPPKGEISDILAIPIGSIRQWIETRIKEIHSNGQQSDRRGQAPQDI